MAIRAPDGANKLSKGLMTGILYLVGFPFLISNLGKTKTQLATSELFQNYV